MNLYLYKLNLSSPIIFKKEYYELSELQQKNIYMSYFSESIMKNSKLAKTSSILRALSTLLSISIKAYNGRHIIS